MVALQGDITVHRVRHLTAELSASLANHPIDLDPIELDLTAVQKIDSAGVAMLALFARGLHAEGRSLKLVGTPEPVAETLRLFPFVADASTDEAPERSGLLERLGEWALQTFIVGLQVLQLFADTAWFLVADLFKRKGLRWGVVAYEMSAMGARAVGVVGLISFLVGATMALQSATQLRQFGANIFVVDLIGISMTRELGPLMAAIVVAGRSGSSVAAEIGTMVISEEIDALKTMGLHPTRFLVVPKMLAISLTQPLLTVLADLFGIFGGFLVAVLYLEVGPTTFVERLQTALFAKDLLTGLIKSVMFAQLIVIVGAIAGFRTRGGADAVGRSTTTAVVAGIFAVIVADAVASLAFYFGE